MKFRNPKTGEIYDVTEKTDSLITGFCMGIWCGGCPIIKHTNGRMLCVDWVNEHPHTAARMMEQWEQDWIADVQRRREQMGGCAT